MAFREQSAFTRRSHIIIQIIYQFFERLFVSAISMGTVRRPILMDADLSEISGACFRDSQTKRIKQPNASEKKDQKKCVRYCRMIERSETNVIYSSCTKFKPKLTNGSPSFSFLPCAEVLSYKFKEETHWIHVSNGVHQSHCSLLCFFSYTIDAFIWVSCSSFLWLPIITTFWCLRATTMCVNNRRIIVYQFDLWNQCVVFFITAPISIQIQVILYNTLFHAFNVHVSLSHGVRTKLPNIIIIDICYQNWPCSRQDIDFLFHPMVDGCFHIC